MNNFSFFILSSAIKTMEIETKKYYLRETGGILIGYWNERKNQVVITHATGPGPKSFHGLNYFEPDTKFCQKKLNKLFKITKGRLTYLGDWHSHPWNFLKLSSVDLRTMEDISEDKDFKCRKPIAVITNFSLNKFYSKTFLWLNKENEPQIIKPFAINEITGLEIPVL